WRRSPAPSRSPDAYRRRSSIAWSNARRGVSRNASPRRYLRVDPDDAGEGFPVSAVDLRCYGRSATCDAGCCRAASTTTLRGPTAQNIEVAAPRTYVWRQWRSAPRCLIATVRWRDRVERDREAGPRALKRARDDRDACRYRVTCRT